MSRMQPPMSAEVPAQKVPRLVPLRPGLPCSGWQRAARAGAVGAGAAAGRPHGGDRRPHGARHPGGPRPPRTVLSPPRHRAPHPSAPPPATAATTVSALTAPATIFQCANQSLKQRHSLQQGSALPVNTTRLRQEPWAPAALSSQRAPASRTNELLPIHPAATLQHVTRSAAPLM